MKTGIGAAVEAAREKHGWSIQELAEAAKVNKETVNRIELGANTTLDKLRKVARALGLELVVRLIDPAEITTTDLSDGELTLLGGYRQLTEREKTTLHMVLDAMVTTPHDVAPAVFRTAKGGSR